MRIAVITTGFSKNETDFGGAAAFHNLIKELSFQSNIELSVFAFYYPTDRDEYNFYNAKVFSFGSPGKLNEYKKFNAWRKCEKKFVSEHKKNKFDIVHSMWAGESGFVASRFARKYNIPFIANIAGGELADLEEIGYGSRTKQLQKYFVDMAFSKADTIISGSNFITEMVMKYYGEIISSKVRKIPFGVDENVFKPAGNVAGDSTRAAHLPALINIANVVPVKSHKTLFNAIKIVAAVYPEVQLECYGKDEKNILEDLAWGLGVAGNVKSDGFRAYEQIPEVLSKEGICVSSSLYESENMSIIEAAFCGLPVVSSSVGAAPEITEHLAPSGDHITLAEKIINVIENYPEERNKAINKRDSLVDKYSLKNSVHNFVDLYRSLSSL